MSTGRRGALRGLLPRFWSAGIRLRPYASLKSYPRAWALSIGLLTAAALLPVILGAFLDYRLIGKAMRREHDLRVERLVSNARRTVAHFLEERLEALSFAAHSIGRDRLEAPEGLERVFENLREDFGGLTDLGLIDETGRQVAYCGPFDLAKRDYGAEHWFRACLMQGAFVSDVYRGYRDVPHVVIAVRASPKPGPGYLLRATIDLERLKEVLSPHAPGERDDIFLLNRAGLVQTPSRHHGQVLEPATIEVPPYSEHTEVLSLKGEGDERATLGYAYVRTRLTDTPFVLVMTRDESDVVRFATWLTSSRVVFVGLTTLGLLIVVALTLTYMFNRLYDAESVKARALGQMEDVDRLASLGRLAAGVAHEVNNPLAVIKESAGYVEDLLDGHQGDLPKEELREQAQVITESVTRCAAISRQLLSFARPRGFHPARVDLKALVRDVLRFHAKEAEFKSIEIATEVDEEARFVETDGGKLQQVLLNLIMNAIDAMPGGGELGIRARREGEDEVRIEVSDTGCGIPAEALKNVFEPFFTTKPEGRGTGLGLSITYGIVSRLGGRITADSVEGVGSVLSVVLPVRAAEGEEA